MKHVFLYPLVSVLTLGISGVGSYLYQDLSHKSNKNNTSDTNKTTEEEPPIDSVPEETGFSKMINKLMETKEVKADNAAFVIHSIGNDNVYLDFTHLDLDLSGVLSGDVSSLKFNTSLRVRYQSVDETLSVHYDSDLVYIDYQTQAFAFDAPKTVTGFLPILSSLNISLPTLPDFSGIDASDLLNQAMGILDTVEETPTQNGYEYTLDCDKFFSSLDLPITLKGAKVILVADSDYNFIGGRTSGDGININDAYQVSLDVSSIEVESSSSYQGLSEDEKKAYTDITGTTSNLFSTFASLMDKKNFRADLSLTMDSEEQKFNTQTLEGTVKGDLSNIVKDVTKGTFEVSLDHKNNGNLANHVYATYKENNIYIALNNMVKGKISSKTISDLIPVIAGEIDQDSLPQIADNINTILKGTDLEKLLNGDLSVYKNFIKDFSITSNGFEMTINAKAFGLGDYEIVISLKDSSNDLSNGFSLSLSNLQYQGLILSFAVNLTPEDAIVLEYTDKEFAAFKDYGGILPIFSTLTKLADERKLNTAYSFRLEDLSNKTSYQANGAISADITNLSLGQDNNYYGDYRLTLNTSLNGYDHNLDFVYQDHDLFLTMDTFFKQKMSDSEVSAIYDLLNKDKEGTSEAFDGINTVISSITSEIKSTYSLKILEDYFTLDKDNVDKNILRLDLNLPKFFENSTLSDKISSLSLLVNTDENRITSLACNGFKIDNKYQLDFQLNLEDVFTDFRLSEEETKGYTEISSASKILNGFFSLPTDLTKFSVNLDGSINQKGEDGSYQTYMGMSGDAQVNLEQKDSPDVGGTLHLIQQGDSLYDKQTDHRIHFTYSGTHNDGQTLAEYTANDLNSNGSNNTTKLIMNNTDLFSIYDRVMSIKEKDNNLLYPYLKGYFDTAEKVATGLPLLDAIQNKDYTILLNDYIKEAKIEDKTVTLKLASSILNYDDESGNTDTIVVQFDENYKIKSATIEGFYSDYQIQASISLDDYSSEEREAANIEYKGHEQDFIDVHGFDVLLNCFITTTEHHFFDLSGYLNLNLSLGSWSLKDQYTYYHAYVSIVDSTVQAYLSFQKEDNTTIDNKNFYGVEFFVENEFVLSERSQTSSKGVKSVELYRLSPKEITDNIVYYLLSYIYHIESYNVAGIRVGYIILGQIYKAMNDDSNDSSVTINHNYSSLIDKAVLDETNRTMNLTTCSLSNLISIPVVSLGKLTANMKYDEENELSSFDIHVPLSISAISGNVDFVANRNSIVSLNDSNFIATENAIKNEKMKRYDTFMNAYHSSAEYQALEEYHFINFSCNDLGYSAKYEDNGKKLNYNYSDTTRRFFFGITD